MNCAEGEEIRVGARCKRCGALARDVCGVRHKRGQDILDMMPEIRRDIDDLLNISRSATRVFTVKEAERISEIADRAAHTIDRMDEIITPRDRALVSPLRGVARLNTGRNG